MARSVKPRIERRLLAIAVIVVFVVASAFAAYRYIPKADVATTGCGSDIAIALDTSSNASVANLSAGGSTYTQAFPEGLGAVTTSIRSFLDYFDRVNAVIPNTSLKADLALGTFPNDIGFVPLTTDTSQLRNAMNGLTLSGSSDVETGLYQGYSQLQQGRAGLPKQKKVLVLISPALDDYSNPNDVNNTLSAAATIENDVTVVGIQLGNLGYMQPFVYGTTPNFGPTFYRAFNSTDLNTDLQAVAQYICNASGTTGTTVSPIPSPVANTTGVSVYLSGGKQRLRPGDTTDLQYVIINNTNQTLSNVSINQSLPSELALTNGSSSFVLNVGTVPANQQLSRTVTIYRK